jgi:uncharacterized protein
LSFYQQALHLQRQYAKGRHIDNCIQTNGTLLNDEWCRFFKENNFLVGVSIDGPQHFHDIYRCKSFEKVMRGIELLNKYDVQWNAMAVVNNLNVEHPVEFYRFFRDTLNCRFLQFTPIVERYDASGMLVAGLHDGGKLTATSVTAEQWGRFLCEIFDEWVRNDVGEMFVQLFDATLANWCGVQPSLCAFGEVCGDGLVVEHNGDVYSCDHFVYPEYRLGNIMDKELAEMYRSPEQQTFGRDKRDALPMECKRCSYYFLCHGECPKHRFAYAKNGEPYMNVLCEGYKMFFRHTDPYMRHMKTLIEKGEPAAKVMEWKK